MADRDVQIRASLNANRIESGERERMKQLLQQRLMEYEWRDQMKAYCKALLPDTIKKKMLARLRQYLPKHEKL